MSEGTLASAISTDKPKKLLDRVRDALRVKHYSVRTERSYCDWIERFIRFHSKRHPSEMGEAEVSGFLTYLAREGEVAASTQNQARKSLLRSTPLRSRAKANNDFRCITFTCCAQ